MIVHARVYVTYLFVSIKASSCKWGQSFYLIYTRVGKKFENDHMENSTHWYFFLYMNRDRKKNYFRIHNKLITCLKLTLYSLVIV